MLPRASAFSLVELSIVLVILGLLVGGILAGQSLIHAAELRKTSELIPKTQTSFHAFRDKYFALPGDITNATSFWGAANTAGAGGQCANILTNAGTGTQTCNGNGDGQVVSTESYRQWQHLANAGLIEGGYTGVAGPNPGTSDLDDVIGTNVPGLPVNAGGMNVYYFSQSNLETYYSFNLPAGNYLRMGTCCNAQRNLTSTVLPAVDTWNIDTKIDDGKPYLGAFQVMKGYFSGCASTNANNAANYVFTSTALTCAPFAKL